MLHPPYTAWHLSYVLIGAAIAPRFHLDRLLATLIAFGLAVGVGAHGLDELRGRPLRTRISSPVLATVSVAAICGAVALGALGIDRADIAGHSHGGQVCLPLVGPLILPPMGKKYVEGLFRFGHMQLYVNRGIGTVGVPFRLNCMPEITLATLRTTPNATRVT